jgi:hypothetical protein
VDVRCVLGPNLVEEPVLRSPWFVAALRALLSSSVTAVVGVGDPWFWLRKILDRTPAVMEIWVVLSAIATVFLLVVIWSSARAARRLDGEQVNPDRAARVFVLPGPPGEERCEGSGMGTQHALLTRPGRLDGQTISHQVPHEELLLLGNAAQQEPAREQSHDGSGL